MAPLFLPLSLFQPNAQLLEAGAVALTNVAGNRLCGGSVVGVRGEIAVLNHQHPALTITDQSQAKGLAEGVAGTQQGGIALTAQQIPQRVPTQFKAVFKRLDQALLLAFIERRRLKEAVQLLQGAAEVGEALLPAHICGHGPRLSMAGTGG